MSDEVLPLVNAAANGLTLAGIAVVLWVLTRIYSIKREAAGNLAESRNLLTESRHLLTAVKEWAAIGKGTRDDVKAAAERTEKKADAVAVVTGQIKQTVEKVAEGVEEIRSGPFPTPDSGTHRSP